MSDETTEERGAPTLTYPQARNRADEVHARMEQINELDNPTPEEDAEFRSLGEEFDSLTIHMGRLERAAEIARVRSSASQIGKPASKPVAMRFEPGSGGTSRGDYDRDSILEPDSIEDCRFRNPWDLSEVRTWGRDNSSVAGELRARALSGIEKIKGTSDNVRQAMANIIEGHDSVDSKLARQFLVTSSPAYTRAFSKAARGKQNTWTPEEAQAVDQVDQFRAMSLTDNQGGYLVPFQLDPTVIITSDGTRNDIRQAARQVIAVGDTWNGVSSAQVSWSWDTEASEVSDDSTTFAQPSIPNYTARGFVPISIEALQDEQNVAQEVAKLLAMGKDSLEASAFSTGTGSGQPTGIITALVASSPTVIVNSVGSDAFAIADVYALNGALPARYRSNASWLANNLIYNKIRQFDTAGGAGLWAYLGDGRPGQLLMGNVLESEGVDGTYGSGENYVLVYGDFQHYVITDRIGLTVEFIPHLFHTSNNRPSGQRGWFAYYRTGADSVSDGAFRLLDVT
jgi:HK97 family phage major capsid protein